MMNQNNDSPVIAPPAAVIASEARQSMPSSMPDDDEISLLDLLQVVVDNLRLLVLGPLAAGLLALGYSFTITPTFTATTKFMPPQQQQSAAGSMLQSLGGLGGLAGAAAGLRSPIDQYVAFLKSRVVQDSLIDRFQLLDRYETKFREDARDALSSNVQIASGKDGLITIDASDKAPAFAAQLANAHVEELARLLNRLAITEAQQRRLFFEKQLVNAKDNLVKAEQALKISGINSTALKANPGATVEGMARLKASITVQEIKLGSMRGYLTESAPDFKQAQIELTALRDQMKRAEKDETTLGTSGDSDYIARFRDFRYNETLFELFTKQYEIARVDESREGAVIQVLDAAQPPERRSKPKKAQIAMLTTLATSLVLMVFIIFRQSFRVAARSRKVNLKMHLLRQAWRRALGRS